MTENSFFVKLKDRGLIHIEGEDRKTFLQGLITNDINKLTPNTPLYACLLNAQGKFLHDFFVIEGDDFILLDCEGKERTADLFKRLNMYRLRADVQISLEEHNDVYAILGSNEGLPDPRHTNMGNRSFERPNLEEKPFEEWDKRRIELTIPDGSRDLIVEKSTMDEASMDKLNAIDYDKGCYVGQELTARMHYRGLGKRKLQTVSLDAPPKNAELRSSCNEAGIALVKLPQD
jgi:folate-binding protein YgfZ